MSTFHSTLDSLPIFITELFEDIHFLVFQVPAKVAKINKTRTVFALKYINDS